MASKELVPRHVQRALTYLRLLNGQGIDPSREDIDRFACNSAPRGSRRVFSAAALVDPDEPALATEPAEPVTDYMLIVGWAEASNDHVHLTMLGHAVLRGLDLDAPLGASADRNDVVTDVTLEPTDALALVRLTRVMASAGAGLLADPYFKAEQVQLITETTSLRRILVSSKTVEKSAKRAESEQALIALALRTVPGASDLEVRSTDSREFHDRCVLAADGRVYLIGSSVNGIGKHLTAVITAPGDVAQFYRTKYEGFWAAASPIRLQSPSGGGTTANA
jgi:hypothetical protein